MAIFAWCRLCNDSPVSIHHRWIPASYSHTKTRPLLWTNRCAPSCANTKCTLQCNHAHCMNLSDKMRGRHFLYQLVEILSLSSIAHVCGCNANLCSFRCYRIHFATISSIFQFMLSGESSRLCFHCTEIVRLWFIFWSHSFQIQRLIDFLFFSL